MAANAGMAIVWSIVSISLLVFGGKSLVDRFADNYGGPNVRGSNDVASETVALRSRPDAAAWDALKALLDGWEFTSEYAVSVGNAQYGNLFTYEGGNFTMKTKIPTGSTSKWPSAMMFAGLVGDGTISSLDDPVHKYLSWWTKDPKDLRSTVTFRMLLSFTSGFGDGHPGEEMNTRAARKWRKENKVAHPVEGVALERRLASHACDTMKGDVTACAKSLYHTVELIGKPGEVYSYNSNHLQMAAAVSVAASGLNIHQVIEKYLLKPYGMSDSMYYGKCPDFGASLITTGADYELFLRGLTGYSPLPKAIIEASEQDATPFMSSEYSLYGDYGFGHFLMCFDSVNGFTQQCKDAHCHMDPGAFGFIPIIDRKYNYYMEVVAAEMAPTGSYPLSGIPEYLAVAIKPHIDAIMSGKAVDTDAFSHHEPQFLSMSVADVNYCADCRLHPEHCG